MICQCGQNHVCPTSFKTKKLFLGSVVVRLFQVAGSQGVLSVTSVDFTMSSARQQSHMETWNITEGHNSSWFCHPLKVNPQCFLKQWSPFLWLSFSLFFFLFSFCCSCQWCCVAFLWTGHHDVHSLRSSPVSAASCYSVYLLFPLLTTCAAS